MAQKHQREVNSAVNMEAICQEIICLSGGQELKDVSLVDPCTGTTRATYRVSDDCPQCGCPVGNQCALKYAVALCPSLDKIAQDLAKTCRRLFVEDERGGLVFDLPSFTRLSPSLTTAGRFSRDYDALRDGLGRFLRAEDRMVSSYLAIARDPASAFDLAEGVEEFRRICGGDVVHLDTDKRRVLRVGNH